MYSLQLIRWEREVISMAAKKKAKKVARKVTKKKVVKKKKR